MRNHKTTKYALIVLSVFLIPATVLMAMPPTEEAVRKWKAEGVWEERVAAWKAFKAAGGSAPSEHSPLEALRANRKASLSTPVVDTIRICVIMVDFPDYSYTDNIYAYNGQPIGSVAAEPEWFDSLLFSQQGVDSIYNPNGSMTDFYLENSFGALMIQGDVYGWYTAPKDYHYYVGTNYGLGGGAAELAGAAVDAAHADGVDFSIYANGDTEVEGIVLVHAGPGAENGSYGIWSHRSSFNTRFYDGVRISDYTVNPEEYGNGMATMGVFSHEYGHIFGLPDLYDINDGSSGSGIGKWSIMSGGSWNGTPGGSRPAFFDAWSKMRLGFIDVVWLEENLYQAEIPAAEENPVAYALGKTPGNYSNDYWLVENRQPISFDESLPGSGLCIYHVDPAVTVQNNPARYMVALEQADGLNDLSLNGGSDGGDPWPGTSQNFNFHQFSVPDSYDNDGAPTQVGVWDISFSGPTMYADLDVLHSRPWVVFAEDKDSIQFDDSAPGGNGNGVLEAGETIEAYFMVRNKMRVAYIPSFSLSVDNEDVAFSQNGVLLKSNILGTTYDSENEEPITFSLPSDFESTEATFTLTIIADSTYGIVDSAYSMTIQFDWTLGRPQVLLVDDDNGQSFESRYSLVLDRMRTPHEIWDKSTGSPTAGDLSPYQSVIWFTGANTGTGGSLTSADISAIEQFLDGGGSLFLNSMTSAQQLQTLDSAFMADYLHATFNATGVFGLGWVGEDGNQIGDGTKFGVAGTAPIDPTQSQILAPYAGGEAAFQLNQSDLCNASNVGVCGVTYSGSYRTVFTTFGFEFVGDGNTYFDILPPDSLMRRVLNFFRQGTVTAVDNKDQSELLPNDFALEQNYPNPFNPTTTISYTVGTGNPISGPVATRLAVYNSLGQKVVTLVDKLQWPGNYEVTWDGTNSAGTKVASGIYLYRLEYNDQESTKKMILLK